MTDTPHSVDDQVVYRGQLYKLARTEPYTRRDTATTVSTWRSHCASCGVSFELRRTPTARQSSGGERILRLSAAQADQHRRAAAQARTGFRTSEKAISMNRHERRRRAAMARENKFVDEYVHHLPEVGPDVIEKGGVTHMVCYHDEWCRIYDGKECNCEPQIRFFAEPNRS